MGLLSAYVFFLGFVWVLLFCFIGWFWVVFWLCRVSQVLVARRGCLVWFAFRLRTWLRWFSWVSFCSVKTEPCDCLEHAYLKAFVPFAVRNAYFVDPQKNNAPNNSAWGCRLAWSRLVASGAIDPGSNPGGPTTFPNQFGDYGVLFWKLINQCPL